MAKDTESAPAARSRAKTSKRTNDPERTTAAILAAATHEFAAKGLAGARIEAIADATHTRKFMIYYYFQNKEALYLAVLENAYRDIRTAEASLNLLDMDPLDALRTMVTFSFDYHESHPEFVRLVMAENMNNGEYLRQSKVIRELNASVMKDVKTVYQRGVEMGLFRPGIDPVDIHTTISALSFHHVSNRPTFALIFGASASSKRIATRRKSVLETVMRYVTAPGSSADA
ncbi:TetR/AcrR family transcriptional regulator [Burkholderia sp. Ax-1719]|uniref:TetR/AcrR family transcriptional regulator n=1 Tax=Burkholderia sp. Ax-1719 TaxID=2608334 RepID=UPI00141F113F|nr:TetR/AcrR family transcriptional regulator [Burkholderia sp. Ax-1719]NIE65899.1 TetR family transcriptional regulator [Burkholderia sp. Ax-1719]